MGFNMAGALDEVRFNTQPPEGGWFRAVRQTIHGNSFNTQPPEGGWQNNKKSLIFINVSTHSRLKAAGLRRRRFAGG